MCWRGGRRWAASARRCPARPTLGRKHQRRRRRLWRQGSSRSSGSRSSRRKATASLRARPPSRRRWALDRWGNFATRVKGCTTPLAGPPWFQTLFRWHNATVSEQCTAGGSQVSPASCKGRSILSACVPPINGCCVHSQHTWMACCSGPPASLHQRGCTTPAWSYRSCTCLVYVPTGQRPGGGRPALGG